MNQIDPIVAKETKYILAWELILSALMQAVFLLIGEWDYTVLLGNILSASAAVLNFFLMGISIQKALEKDENDAKKTIKLSQSYRFLFLIVVLAVGVSIPCFNLWAVLIPILFPRIAIVFRPYFDRKES